MECFFAWREFERRLSLQKGIRSLLGVSIKVKCEKGTTFCNELFMLQYSLEKVALLSRVLRNTFLRTSGRCNRQSEFTLLHFTIFH